MNYDWDWTVLSPFWPDILRGCLTTLWLTALIILAGTPLGLLLGTALRFAPPPLRWILSLFTDAVRSIPPLISILFCYYFLPSLFIGKGMPVVQIAWVALTLYLAAFAADVVRGAFANVPQGAIDAARALGLSRGMIFRRVEVRYVIRSIMPTVWLLWIGMLKNSSLASVIGVYELTHTANRIISNTFRSVEVYAVVAAVYLAIVLPFSLLARTLEARVLGRSADVI